MAQMCPAKSTIVPFKKQMYSSGSIILSYKDDKCICVSIHAPTRGATSRLTDDVELGEFQSTHPRGVRHSEEEGKEHYQRFNPRTHEGCDFCFRLRFIRAQRFNPRTHEGCDVLSCMRNKAKASFNPRTHEGCDKTALYLRIVFDVSIHAPTRGATASRIYQ